MYRTTLVAGKHDELVLGTICRIHQLYDRAGGHNTVPYVYDVLSDGISYFMPSQPTGGKLKETNSDTSHTNFARGSFVKKRHFAYNIYV